MKSLERVVPDAYREERIRQKAFLFSLPKDLKKRFKKSVESPPFELSSLHTENFPFTVFVFLLFLLKKFRIHFKNVRFIKTQYMKYIF